MGAKQITYSFRAASIVLSTPGVFCGLQMFFLLTASDKQQMDPFSGSSTLSISTLTLRSIR